MANPLIERPLRTLDFPSSSRVSPLGFGFARHAGPSIASPFKGASGNPAQTHDWTVSSTASSSRLTSPRRPAVSLDLSSPPPHNRKRSRRSSSVSSSSTTVSVKPLNETARSDAERQVDVNSLALTRTSLAPQRNVKRMRNAPTSSDAASQDKEIDVGLLLTAVPPSDHLSILLSVLRDDPYLSARILAHLPNPDLGECERQLDRLLDGIKRAAGPVTLSGTSQRAWNRAERDITVFQRTAHTYLTFFISSHSTRPAPDLPTRHALLRIITEAALIILPLIPAPLCDPLPANQYRLLAFAKDLVAHWRAWVKDSVTEVNERGGMFPHSVITNWTETLDRLSGSSGGSAWSSSPAQTFATSASFSHPLVTEFRSTMSEVRDNFVSQVGWTIGRIR